jgi:GR25 family glycosyltransferase involved in LPS biosynthesis
MEHYWNNDLLFGENWFGYQNLYKNAVKDLKDNDIIVEVGAWKGRSSSFLAVEIANSKKDVSLYVVDTWEGSVEHKRDPNKYGLESLYKTFIHNMKPVEKYYVPLRTTSIEASEMFEDNSLSFVFIDASHEYEDVKEDIEKWLPKVKDGGIIAGHDYTDWHPGVKKAVNECLDKFEVSEDCWIFKKNNIAEKENIKVLFFGRSKKEEVWEHDYILNDILDGRKVSTNFLYLDDIKNCDDEFDVFVYSARDQNNYPWGYMPTFDDVLECVKKTKPRIVIQLSDEFCYEDLQIHNTIANHCELFLRKYHHKNYEYRINTVNIPLGYNNGYGVPKVIPNISERKLNWSYVGDMSTFDKKEIYENFIKIPKYKFDSGILPERMSEVYLDTIFAPCGRGDSSLNSMRLYESSMAGAIPIVVGSKEEIEDTFTFEENPPWLFFNSWKEAEFVCRKLLLDNNKLQEIQDNILFWWQTRISKVKDSVGCVFESKKLEGFPSVNCISIVQSFDRRKLMYDNFKKYGITNYKTHIYERYNDSRDKHKIVSELLDLEHNGCGPITSHLKTIKTWYESTDEPYTIIFEDDVDLSSVKYWNFNWLDFFNRLPDDWKLVQLCLVRYNMDIFTFEDTKFKFRHRCFDDWSGCAYLISREHAKNLIENHIDEDTFYLKYKGLDYEIRESEPNSFYFLLPQVENVIYSQFYKNSNGDISGIYTFPLFCEDIKFDSVHREDVTITEANFISHYEIIDWWKNQAKNYNVDDFFY